MVSSHPIGNERGEAGLLKILKGGEGDLVTTRSSEESGARRDPATRVRRTRSSEERSREAKLISFAISCYWKTLIEFFLLLRDNSKTTCINSETSPPSVTQKDLKRKARSVPDLSKCTEELYPFHCCFWVSAHRESSDSDIRFRSLKSKSQLSSVPLRLQVVVLGPSKVGKTALVLQYLLDCFEDDYDPTIEDIYSHEIEIPGVKIHKTERELNETDINLDAILVI
ncbi:hypothetical protein NPIL_282381 [Nephila pilipes]|uniref:Uncharacterized protein n=1 Tax=Nephila pilipes TaxID=299642 RepID=A0A8X6PM33_NEPPI|nr:hypothetical protein NPIL_282381 [Nephila pilipes]